MRHGWRAFITLIHEFDQNIILIMSENKLSIVVHQHDKNDDNINMISFKKILHAQNKYNP